MLRLPKPLWISLSLLTMLPALSAPQAAPDPAKIVQAIAAKAESAKEYSFEGDLRLEGQRGSEPAKPLSTAKVRLAVAESGKFLLRVQPADKDEYLLMSDGQKSWAYVPKLKQYTEQESAAVMRGEEGEEDGGDSDNERDIAETFAHQIVPVLASLGKDLQAVDIKGTAEVKYEGRKQSWPVLRALSQKDEHNTQNLVQLVLDPATGAIGRMLWLNVGNADKERTIIRMTFDFASFRLGEHLPDSTFTFDPPKKVKLVDAVPIPGQSGSFLLNQPAPDFELKTLDGERVRLSSFRGHPVLLNFWASWCGPCRRELPGLVKIYGQYKDQGLVVLGVNDEGKGAARKFAESANLSFPTVDDSASKTHRQYRVRSIPSVFLINSDGKVVRFFSGARDEDGLRVALKSVGF